MSSQSISAGRPLTLPTQTVGSHATGWWAMLVVILNEAVIFTSLIAAYLYIRFNSPSWPQDGIARPEMTLPIIMTVLLVSASGFMMFAERGIRGGSLGRLRAGLLIAALLAVGFLAIQAYEYLHEDFLPSTNTYGSLFFTITGLHGLHVLVAVLMNIFIQVRAWMGRFNAGRYQAVQNVALYWHFVDAVWLVIITTLYWSTYWQG
ncbi:MAG TPA: cytochrome c oxidase subunit 3 [Anaerolineaceae bacterium]